MVTTLVSASPVKIINTYVIGFIEEYPLSVCKVSEECLAQNEYLVLFYQYPYFINLV